MVNAFELKGSLSPSKLSEKADGGVVIVAVSMSDLRKTIRGIIKKAGQFSVLEAGEGAAVLRLLKDNNTKTDAFVILDWDLEGLSGVGVAREIRSNPDFKDTAIMILMSDPTAEYIGLAAEVGVSGVVLKPFAPVTLVDKFLNIRKGRANPPEHVLLMKAGEDLVEHGSYDEALELYIESQKIKNSARIIVLIGEVYEKKRDFASAQVSYEEAAQMNPLYLKAYNNASSLLMKLGDEASAMGYLEKAVEISPLSADRQATLGGLYLKNGDKQSADRALSEALRLDPTKGVEIGDKYLEAGDAERSADCFRKYLKGDDDLHTYNQLGIALRRQGKWQEAIDEYKKALRLFSDDEALHFNMGKAYLEGEMTFEARECFGKALATNPNFKEATKELQRLGFGY